MMDVAPGRSLGNDGRLGARMTPRERKDMPWVAVIALLVAVAVIAGIVVRWL
jgi:hypothetical protein